MSKEKLHNYIEIENVELMSWLFFSWVVAFCMHPNYLYHTCADFNLNALSEKRVSVFVRMLDVTSRAGYTGDSYAKVHIVGLSHSKQLSKGA